jgi:hypothetical protein
VFSYNGSSVTNNGAGDEDSDIGEVCVSGKVPGTYTVNEVTPPPGYGDASQVNLPVTVAAGTNCTTNLPTGAGVVTFTNPPLADIQVNFRDGGSGETSATSIICTNTGTTGNTTPGHRLGPVGDAHGHRDRSVAANRHLHDRDRSLDRERSERTERVGLGPPSLFLRPGFEG